MSAFEAVLVELCEVVHHMGLNLGVGGRGPRNVPALLMDLPSGQVCWEIEQRLADRLVAMYGRYSGTWDGHLFDERERRLMDSLHSAFVALDRD